MESILLIQLVTACLKFISFSETEKVLVQVSIFHEWIFKCLDCQQQVEKMLITNLSELGRSFIKEKTACKDTTAAKRGVKGQQYFQYFSGI